MTLQQQAIQAVQVLPEEKLPSLIQFAQFLQGSRIEVLPSQKTDAKKRQPGRLKGKIWMAEDFNDTPAEFKEYL